LIAWPRSWAASPRTHVRCPGRTRRRGSRHRRGTVRRSNDCAPPMYAI
jgi:hypothetical protein